MSTLVISLLLLFVIETAYQGGTDPGATGLGGKGKKIINGLDKRWEGEKRKWNYTPLVLNLALVAIIVCLTSDASTNAKHVLQGRKKSLQERYV